MSNILIIKHGSLGDIAQISGAIQDIKENHINDKVFIYGFSNRIDLEKKIFTAKISIDDRYLYDKKLYFNPISDYYFSQFEIDDFGNYKIEIIVECT